MRKELGRAEVGESLKTVNIVGWRGYLHQARSSKETHDVEYSCCYGSLFNNISAKKTCMGDTKQKVWFHAQKF